MCLGNSGEMVTDMEFNYKMRCFGFEATTNHLWYSECNYNALICLDKTDGRIRKIVRIPGNDLCDRNLYSLIFKINQDLILVPNRSNRITCYNIDRGCFSSIPIDDHVMISPASNYTAAYRYGNTIIMLPNRADKIIVYDYISRTISAIEIKNDLLDRLYPKRGVQFRPQYEVVEDYLFIPFTDAGAILKIHLPTKHIEVKLVTGMTGCDTINYYKGTFYLASWNEKKIYALNKELSIIAEYTSFPDEMKADKMIFAYSLLIGETLLYLPQLGNMIVSFDLTKKRIKKEVQIDTVNMNQLKTYFARMQKDKIISLMAGDSCPSVFFYADNALCKKPYCAWDAEYNSKVTKEYLTVTHRLDFVYENSAFRLETLIALLENMKTTDCYEKILKPTGIIGKKIYKIVAGE